MEATEVVTDCVCTCLTIDGTANTPSSGRNDSAGRRRQPDINMVIGTGVPICRAFGFGRPAVRIFKPTRKNGTQSHHHHRRCHLSLLAGLWVQVVRQSLVLSISGSITALDLVAAADRGFRISRDESNTEIRTNDAPQQQSIVFTTRTQHHPCYLLSMLLRLSSSCRRILDFRTLGGVLRPHCTHSTLRLAFAIGR